MSSPPDGVYHGVDFSGAKRPRSKIWVSTWTGRDPATTRNGFSHLDLVETIHRSSSDGRRHFWLIDAPFNLPLEQLETHGVELGWHATLDWLASFDDPRAWRRACRKVSRVEPRREIDRNAHTPFSPINLRMFKQSWHCMVSVVRPLAAESSVLVLPMGLSENQASPLVDVHVWVGESCPSSILRARGWKNTGYKGTNDANRSAREDLVARLQGVNGFDIVDDARRTAIEDPEGDALDSLILLLAGPGFAATDHEALLREDERAKVEGWVYV
ncbi:MAG: DUF429 domain-containing protein [Planctomycetes bacterium]|nr:DUF429 domain-containing protein [Planctomycetota bacterium]